MTEFDPMLREIQAGERWLKSVDAPVLPPALAARIKAAVRSELASSSRTGTWRRWHAAVAAAAMLLLSAGVVRQMSAAYRAAWERVRPLEQFAASLDAVQQTDAALALLEQDIDGVGRYEIVDNDSTIEDLSESVDVLTSDTAVPL